MKTLLIIEDDRMIRESLDECLRREGFRVSAVGTLADARRNLVPPPDLIVLDWLLPDGQGIDFLRELRAAGGTFPVLLLTARADLVDKVVGLESGADDYLTKPFEPRELVARIRARLRTVTPPAADHLEVAGITINRVTRDARFCGQSVELRKMEYDLLLLFLENPNKAFSREELLNKVWGLENFPTTRTVDTHILALRQKFGDALFETVRGIGYRLRTSNE